MCVLRRGVPATANPSDLNAKGLAGLYREPAYNDIHRDEALLGAAADRTCDLLLTHPPTRARVRTREAYCRRWSHSQLPIEGTP